MPEHSFLGCGDLNLFGVVTIIFCFVCYAWVDGKREVVNHTFGLQQIPHSSHFKYCAFYVDSVESPHAKLRKNSLCSYNLFE